MITEDKNMSEDNTCIGGDGGPLVLLQASAAAQWQGAIGFGDVLPNGEVVETDYDILWDSSIAEGICVITLYDRDMLVLWDSEFGAILRSSRVLSLPADTLVLTMCYADEDWSDILPALAECIWHGKPKRSLPFNMHDATLRLQVGADSADPSYSYPHTDVPIVPGTKRCDIYWIERPSLRYEVVIIRPD